VLAARACSLNALLIVIVLEIALHLPVSLELSRWNFLKLTVLYLASAIPFFFTGVVFFVVFARQKTRIAQLCGADLSGAAAACLALVPLMNLVGGPNTIVFSALAMALAVPLAGGLQPGSEALTG